MPESSQNNRFSFNDSEGEATSWQPPLGIRNPLVTPNPLGQNFLSPKFLSPLGAQPLGGGNPLGSSVQALPDYNLSENFFQDSPPLAESRLSLNPPEAAVTAAATPTAGMDSTQVNIQRYPAETPTANGHEHNPILAAPDSLSEAERRLLGQDQAQVTTQELQLAAPHEQLGASDTTPLNPKVVQPKLATEPLLQREIAIPEAPEAIEPIRESSVSQPEPRVQIPEVTEESSAIANANPSVMRSADLSNLPPPQTSPVAPLPSLSADHLSGIEPIVSFQAELSPVHPIELAQDTEQNTQDVPSVPVQRQEDEASPPSFVESLPLASQALPDGSQPPQSFVQTQATADSPPPLNQPTGESPPEIAPVLASDSVNVQPSVQPDSDSEAITIAETSDFPPSTAGASATEGESLQESGITPSEPTVVQAFAETESSALSQTAAAPLESPVLTQPEPHQSSIIDEPVADSSTPLAKPELATITPSSPPILEEPHQPTETLRLDTDAAPSHSEIVQPRLETEPSAQSEAVFAPASDAATHPEPLVSPPSPVTDVSETPVEATPVAESELTIAQPFSEPESSEFIEVVSSQDNERSTPSIPTTPTAALSTPVNEPIANALPTSTESGATETNVPKSVVQSLPEGEDIDTPRNEVLETPDPQLISETTPTLMKAEEVHQEGQQGAAIVEDTGEDLPPEENSSATLLLTSDTASTPSAISTNLLQRSTTADAVTAGESEITAIAPTQEEVIAHPDITSPTSPQESAIQRQPLPETEETIPDAIAPTPEEAIAHPDITSPSSPEASAIQRQPLPETEETPPSAIAPTPEEAIAHPDITSPSSPEASAIQRQPLPETEETPPSAIAPTPEEAITPPDITSPTTPEASSIHRQLLPQTEETAPDAIAPTPEEAITPADITSSTTPEASSIQRQTLLQTEETVPSAIAPTPEEAITPPDITSPTAAQESAIHRHLLPETAPVDKASTPSASETELPSTISQAITTDSTLVMPKGLPDEAKPVSYPTQPESLQPTEISRLDENSSLTEPIIPQPLLESDANWQSERLPTAKNSEEAQENSPQVSPASPNSPLLPAHLLQTKTNLTEDESFNQNQDVPQLPTVLENLVGTRHTLPLIQPLNQHSQQSSLLSTASTSEFLREQSTIVQSMPETSHQLVVPNTTSSTLPENAFNQALQSTVKVPSVSLNTEPLTLQRATDTIPQTTPESNQETQRVGNSTYTSEIPNSWSSIADLLENTTTNSSSAFGGETPIQMAFNDSINQAPSDWQESNPWENLIPEYSRSSDASSSVNQETPIQRFTTEEASVQDDTSAAENPAQEKDAQDEDEQNLEILAREIYSLVQQRLAIERERYGHY